MGVGVGQSEVMVSGDPQFGNYSSTRIAQLVPLKCFEADQGEILETVVEFYEKWLRTEVVCGHVRQLRRVEDESQLECSVTKPQLPNFEGELTAQYAIALMETKLVGKRRAREIVGEDPDTQEAQVRAEEAEELERQMALQPAAQPGEVPGRSLPTGHLNAGPVHDPDTGQWVSKAEQDVAARRKAEKEADQAKAEQEQGQEALAAGRQGNGWH